jgi:hypothetical protein
MRRWLPWAALAVVVVVALAVGADPSYPEAHFFRAMILWKDKGDPAGAVAEFRLFLANTSSSDDAAQVQPLLDQAQAEAAGTTVPQQ